MSLEMNSFVVFVIINIETIVFLQLFSQIYFQLIVVTLCIIFMIKKICNVTLLWTVDPVCGNISKQTEI